MAKEKSAYTTIERKTIVVEDHINGSELVELRAEVKHLTLLLGFQTGTASSNIVRHLINQDEGIPLALNFLSADISCCDNIECDINFYLLVRGVVEDPVKR